MSKLALQHILVIDIEATCWNEEPPPGMLSDIIEVGICVLETTTGTRDAPVSLIVQPTSSTVSPFCTALTTLTQAQVDQGMTFAQACAELEQRFATKSRVWVSYGDYDRQIFQTQCEREQIPYPFGPHHLDLKVLAPLLLGWKHPVGMARALKRLEIPLEGTHHRGDSDAWNTARFWQKSSHARCNDTLYT